MGLRACPPGIAGRSSRDSRRRFVRFPSSGCSKYSPRRLIPAPIERLESNAEPWPLPSPSTLTLTKPRANAFSCNSRIAQHHVDQSMAQFPISATESALGIVTDPTSNPQPPSPATRLVPAFRHAGSSRRSVPILRKMRSRFQVLDEFAQHAASSTERV